MNNRIGYLVLNTTLASVFAVSLVGCGNPPDALGMPAPSTTIGTEIDDSVITSSVKSALLADSEIKSFDFKVETRKGEVMLSGFVDNKTQLDRATAATMGVSGVKGIQNKVALKGIPTTVGNKIDDSITSGKVKAALLGDEKMRSNDITVVTRKDEVQLSGFVNNQAQMDRAIEITRGVDGVSKVSNEMMLKK